jgi:hypothetical protein
MGGVEESRDEGVLGGRGACPAGGAAPFPRRGPRLEATAIRNV